MKGRYCYCCYQCGRWSQTKSNIYYVELLEARFIFKHKGGAALETSYLCLVFLAHTLEVLTDCLSRTRNRSLILLAQLADQRNIKGTRLIFVINLCV